MKVIKEIDYIAGFRPYNTFELTKYDKLIWGTISQVTTIDEVETTEYKSTVWFALDDCPCEITSEDIEWLNTTEETSNESGS